jgi:hypothetical protein
MHQMRISTNQVSSVVLGSKKLEIRKIVKTVKEPKKTKYCAMKLSWFTIYSFTFNAQDFFFTFMETSPLPVKECKI